MSGRGVSTQSADESPFRVSRRNFLRAAGASAALATAPAAGAIAFSQSRAAAQGQWDHEADIIIVGSGGAALVAAAIAADLGNEVLILEKAPEIGGTTAKSGGGHWIPNNHFLREEGLDDPREDAIRYMIRYSYPQFFNPDDPEGREGAFENDYNLIAAMYDNGYVASDRLEEIGALLTWPRLTDWDYYEHFPENKRPQGRSMNVRRPDGTQGSGADMILQLSEFVAANGAETLTSHRVERLVLNDAGAVIGVEASTSDGATVAARARKAVIFGTGGFTNNRWMVLHYQRGPTWGGCEVPTNEGDFINIAGAVGAKMGNMTGAFHAQVVVEHALDSASVPTDVFLITGDSSMLVNRFGVRVVNEKRDYNNRTQIHYNWDVLLGGWTNGLLFLVYDQRVADYWGGSYPIPGAGVEAPYLITGDTLADLTVNIDDHLAELGGRVGGVRLDSAFNVNIHNTVARYNAFARAGRDLDFQRGDFPYDQWRNFGPSAPDFREVEWPDPDQPNRTMYPLSDTGPFYAIIIGAGTLSTNGGPVINEKAQVVNTADQPIPGLYGAGSCIASPSASAYWGGGGTLGPAVAFGYIAAVNAHEEPVKDA